MRGRKRKKKASKSHAQRMHAKKRAWQRYMLDINQSLYKELVDNIKNQRFAYPIERQSHRVTTYLVKVWESWYPVAFDKLRKEIVTFLPQEYFKDVDFTNVRGEVIDELRKMGWAGLEPLKKS